MTNPEEMDIGDYLEVPPDQRLDIDDDEPNPDADDDLSDVEEGDVCDDDLTGEA